MQRILDSQEGVSFRPEINSLSRSLTRSVDTLLEWRQKNEQKKQRLREMSEESERTSLQLSSRKLISRGSEAIN